MVHDEEKLQLRADVERYKRVIRQKDEMLEEMEYELSRPKTPADSMLTAARERDLVTKIRDLEIEIDAKNVTITHKDGQIDELRDEVDKLEKSNRDLVYHSESPSQDSSSSFLENELARLSEELDTFRETTSSLINQNLEYEKELLQLRSDLESATEHVKNLENHLQTREEELARLEGEIVELKALGHGKFATAGNSIFAEAMEHEKKLEEDLKFLFAQNQRLLKKVRFLQIEKEDAEQRVQSAMRRKYTVTTAISYQGFAEMDRLRQKVRELEVERTHLWERLFVKMRCVSKREFGPVVVAHYESFKLSIASVTGNQENVLKENEELSKQVHRLENINAEYEEQVKQLKYDLETAERKAKSAVEEPKDLQDSQVPPPICTRPIFFSRKPKPEVAQNPEDEFTSGKSHPLLNAPLKPMSSAVRNSFFVKPSRDPIDRGIKNMSVENSLQMRASTLRVQDQEKLSDFTLHHQRAKAERKAAAPPAELKLNYIQLIQPTTTTSKLKPAILWMSKSTDK